MKKTIIIILISGLVLIAVLWGASQHFGWFEENHTIAEEETIEIENKTKVFDLIVLDMSGSMGMIQPYVVAGFNSFIDGLRSANQQFSATQEHYLTLYVFNEEFKKYVYNNIPIDSASYITMYDYKPFSFTPLYDAMGTAISDMITETDTLSEYSVMVTIITDGMENASLYYTKDTITQMIKSLSDKGWSFTYFGTDREVLRQAIDLNIDSVYFFERSNSGIHDALILDEHSRVSKSKAIDSIRKRKR
ncbi:MAG: hypothetical protein II401_03295 [Bacteroidales bacterium]|nr:hypothetical protein [Bacteroidales bacterium]